ncbi:hypothetical protein D3C87_2147310 [compost metagenome]
MSQPITSSATRKAIPLVKGMPAALAAITVAKGLMVEPSVPMPAPSKMVEAATTGSKRAASITGTNSV